MMMRDEEKTREQLIEELAILRRRLAALQTPPTQTLPARKEAGATRYHNLFEDSPVSLWEADFSAVKAHLDRLRRDGVEDLGAYLDQQPEAVTACLNVVQIGAINQATLKLFRAGSQRELLENLDKLVTPEILETIKAFLLTIAAGRSRFEAEIRAQTLEGVEIYVNSVWTTARGYESTYAQVLISLIDITGSRQAEEAYRALVDHALQGMAILQTEAGLVFANPAMSKILGYPVEELLAMSLADLYEKTVTPEHQEMLWRRLDQWTAGKTPPARFEMQIVRKDGTRRWVERFGTPIEFRGKEAQQIAIIDITDRKRVEEKLQQKNLELEQLNRAIQEFTAILDVEQVLDKVLQGVQGLLNTTGAAIWLVDPETRELVCRRLNTPRRNIAAGWRLKPGEGIAGWVVQTGQSLVAPDVRADARYASQLEQLSGLSLRSVLGVPLQVEGQVMGMIVVGDEKPNHFDSSHLRLIEPLAGAASIAIQNARLYETARQVNQLRILNDFDEALRQVALDPVAAAQVTLQHAAAALNAPSSVLWVLTDRPKIDPDRVFTLDGGWQPDAEGRYRSRYLDRIERAPERDRRLPPDNNRNDLRMGRSDQELLAPFMQEGRPVAALILSGRPADRPFTSQDQALARAIAGRAAQSFQSAWLYEASRARAAYLTTLHAISATVVSSLDLQTVLRRILELVCRSLDADEGFVLLREQASKALLFAMTLTEKTEGLRGRQFDSTQSIAGAVIQQGEPIRIDDVRRDARFSTEIGALTDFEARSLLCAPLLYLNQIIGVIEVLGKYPDQFSQEDLDLLAAVASIATTALQNARLYTASQARATELAILNEIALALTATLDYHRIVKMALSLTRGLFNADYSILLQPHPPETATQSGASQFVAAAEEEEPTERMLLDDRAANWLAARLEPTLITGKDRDPCLPDFVQAAMVVPLLLTDRPPITLSIINRQPEVYTLDDLRTLQAISSILVMALDKAQLYANQKRLMQEQEQAQVQLVQTEKMVALGRLVASIMHEINNPLQAIHNFLGLSQLEMQGLQRQDQINHYLHVAGEEVDRISAIVRNLREFYLPASEGLRPVDLHKLLESVLGLTGKQLERDQVTVDRRWDPTLPPIEANADQLRQVFLNLTLNAIDAMPGGGMLRVTTAPVESSLPSADQPGCASVVKIEFSDTGFGMTEQVRSRLFEPFFTTKTDGSGLGLSISYSIIRAHHGQISVVSHAGLGTTFTILLPLTQPGRE